MDIQTLSKTIPHATDQEIRSAQNKVINRLSANPAAAVTTNELTAHVGEGLTCTVRQGKFSTVMDLGPAMGGAARGPGPGFMTKAGIAGCIAIGVKMAAAREGIEIQSVDLRVETVSDDLAVFGLGENRAAPRETRINLDLRTGAPRLVVEALVANVLECSPWFLALRDPQNVSVSTTINNLDRSTSS